MGLCFLIFPQKYFILFFCAIFLPGQWMSEVLMSFMVLVMSVIYFLFTRRWRLPCNILENKLIDDLPGYQCSQQNDTETCRTGGQKHQIIPVLLNYLYDFGKSCNFSNLKFSCLWNGKNINSLDYFVYSELLNENSSWTVT